MTLSLTLGCLWVIAAAVVALLPLRQQYLPGSLLLASAVPLLWFIAVQHGPLVLGLTFLAAVSMFRKPLFHFARRIAGQPKPPEAE